MPEIYFVYFEILNLYFKLWKDSGQAKHVL